MHRPGEVWYLPPEARSGGDPKVRRYVLLTDCGEVEDAGVFAYASTAAVEATFGGATYRLDPAGRPGIGFDRPTYITPCRLANVESEYLIRRVGRIGGEMREVFRTLRRALGIGRGAGSGVLPAGWRGTFVEFVSAVVHETGIRFGLVVTEPAYSAEQRYQLVVPVLDADEYDPQEEDLILPERNLPASGLDMGAPMLAIGWVQAVFHPSEVSRSAGVAGTATMEAVDAALVRFFHLPE